MELGWEFVRIGFPFGANKQLFVVPSFVEVSKVNLSVNVSAEAG
jgi:hypothetical protein